MSEKSDYKYSTYACHMYSLDDKSKRIKKSIRNIKAQNKKEVKRIWAKTQLGCFELVGIEALEGDSDE